MVENYREKRGSVIHTPLFDRFLSDQPANLATLARDLADILGARRTHAGPGALGWGLSGVDGATATSAEDRDRIAANMSAAIERFEPRLTNVVVTPEGEGGDFRFSVSAHLVQENDRSVVLRVLAPNRGGALGAEVLVLGAQR